MIKLRFCVDLLTEVSVSIVDDVESPVGGGSGARISLGAVLGDGANARVPLDENAHLQEDALGVLEPVFGWGGLHVVVAVHDVGNFVVRHEHSLDGVSLRLNGTIRTYVIHK